MIKAFHRCADTVFHVHSLSLSLARARAHALPVVTANGETRRSCHSRGGRRGLLSLIK